MSFCNYLSLLSPKINPVQNAIFQNVKIFCSLLTLKTELIDWQVFNWQVNMWFFCMWPFYPELLTIGSIPHGVHRSFFRLLVFLVSVRFISFLWPNWLIVHFFLDFLPLLLLSTFVCCNFPPFNNDIMHWDNVQNNHCCKANDFILWMKLCLLPGVYNNN